MVQCIDVNADLVAVLSLLRVIVILSIGLKNRSLYFLSELHQLMYHWCPWTHTWFSLTIRLIRLL